MTQEKLQLHVEKRNSFGKKLKKMRHHGQAPANIFGPSFKSAAVTVTVKDFFKVYKVARETGVIYLQTEKEEVPVLVKHIQYHPVSHGVVHIDFRKIDLKQKIETSVPVKTVNDSPAVTQKGGVLLTQTDTLLVEALPTDIPHEIEIDLTKLVEIGSEIKVKDLPASSTYTIKEEPEKVIVSVIAHKEESITPETTAVAPEITTEKEKEGEEATTEKTPAKEEKPAEPKKEEK